MGVEAFLEYLVPRGDDAEAFSALPIEFVAIEKVPFDNFPAAVVLEDAGLEVVTLPAEAVVDDSAAKAGSGVSLE